MLFERLQKPSPRILLIGLVIPWLSAPVLAETDSAKASKKSEVLIAELAEDESVEDVEQSAPLQTKGKDNKARQPAVPQGGAGIDTPSAGSRKVAPNIDLKQVAPPPEAQVSAPADTDADAAESEVMATEAVAEPEPEPEIREGEVFTLLDNDVLPGTSTRLAWTPGIQIAGLSQTTPVLVVNGINAGPTQGSRYLPDRRDLNRHFPGSPDGSLADRIAHSLFENVIRKCDMLVDIHTGSLKRTNLPQLRADMNNPDVAEFTRGFDRMAVVHSSGSGGMLRTAAVEAGIRTVTLEAGESHRIQQHQISAGVNSLTSLMERQGMISRMFVWGDPEPVYYDSDWIRADHGGILFSEIELGANVSEGEILGYVSDPITNAQHPIRSTTDGRVIGMAVDQVVMAGFAAYHIGTEAEVPGE